IENLRAINYTRNIEDDFSEFIIASMNGPTYIYQKFAIEVSQYINNISILIQDINNPLSFTDENSWEVAILNCSNNGNPNTLAALGTLKKAHPISYSAHWEVFNFKESESGPIYLEISKTNMTTERGRQKYWFAFRIKIPKDDSLTGGGPKFLYFNPDGEQEGNIGEGETFAISPDFHFDDYTTNNVRTSTVESGTLHQGNLNSFKNIDEDRYTVGDTNNITIDITFELKELKNSPLTFWELYTQVFKSLLKPSSDFNWLYDHYKYIFSFDFYLTLNVSNIAIIQSANLSIYNYKGLAGDRWLPVEYDINQGNETTIHISVRTPEEKYAILYFMNNNPARPTANNTLRFRLEYEGMGSDFDVSINQFKVEVGELENLDTIQRYDPKIQKLYFPNELNLINGTSVPFGSQDIESLYHIDEDRYMAQAFNENMLFFITYNVLNDLDSSLWDVDYYDWIASYPNPVVPLMDIRITSNTSVTNPHDLPLAALALYKGNKTFDILDEESNKAEWIIMSRMDQYAHKNETTDILQFDAGFTWLFLNILDELINNQAFFVLLYYTNNSLEFGFNVSINEFSINFYIQNAISSDISSKIGVGLNSETLLPSDIGLKCFGVDVGDSGYGQGVWEEDIDDAAIEQGYFKFNLTSLWQSIRFDASGEYEGFKIIPIIEFLDEPTSQYMTGTQYISIKVFESGGKPIDNKEIKFELLNANNIPVLTTNATSDTQGIATAVLNFLTTGNRFSIRVTFPDQSMFTEAFLVSGYIRIVDDLTLFLDSFMQYLPYILIALAAIVIAISVRQIKRSRNRKVWAGEAMILDDLLKISYIMIINKDVGVSIYDKQISLEGIDSDLISGFLQAISQFRSEIKKKDSTESLKGEGFEMDYYDFKIVITDGNYVRVALILDGTPSEKLKASQTAFTDHFERRYEENLKNFTGDITPFRTSDDLIEKYFNVTLVYPLQLGKHYGVVKLKGLEKALTEVAEQIQKERKFFFVSSLLNYGLAGRKASRDEIISTIISLKNKGLILPVEMK
ncbi:MAG: hypothetical protein ACFFEN_15400, partial [Candidatus Thorarchaeota archaeon]